MNEIIPYDLIARFLSGESSEQENQQLEDWKNSGAANAALFNQMKMAWQVTAPADYIPDTENALKKVSARLESQKRSMPVFSRMRLIAAMLIGIGIVGSYKLFFDSAKLIEVNSLAANEPMPINLPDGSTITLNAGTKLIYPKQFEKKERKIKFEGEAYFTISPDKSRPFIIESNGSITQVLGTEFNLKSITGDSLITLTVTHGLVSIKLFESAQSEEKVAAGEIAKVDKQKNDIHKSVITDNNFMAWRTGILDFENQSLEQILPVISSFYKLTFTCEEDIKTEKIQIRFQKQNLQEAIDNLEVMGIRVEKEGNGYILKKSI